ncbi:hypothetical protein QQM39_40285 [Streptomyces sp. DT2A-34]|uniref:hypothetical protein n=1 Tax=Streptomyces sp. DT2A-34 TaxID=3051182 RepID=UPI00265BE8D1|nr:hypothetical protein [Streptomyces sp. DT2A-34]MDO0916829.1 hypothetical protein [Streptomyces sp. DT2A-34]
MRAEVIGRLLLGEREPVPGFVPALRLRNAVVSGALDLSGCDVPYAVIMTDCSFQEALRLEAASTRLVDLSGSQLPALLMQDAQVDGPLRLSLFFIFCPRRRAGTEGEPLRDRWRLYALAPAAGWGWC